LLVDPRQQLARGVDNEPARAGAPNRLASVEHEPPDAQERTPAAIFVNVESRTAGILDEDAP
jgi:hypothetical protein